MVALRTGVVLDVGAERRGSFVTGGDCGIEFAVLGCFGGKLELELVWESDGDEIDEGSIGCMWWTGSL